VPGTSAAFEVYAEFLPLVQSDDGKRLFDLYAACGATLGHSITGLFTGGCSDAGFAAGAGAPTLCAVGPIGGGAHSPDEFLELASIVPRAQILALTILRCGGHFDTQA
jgi:glutamate carboxypeptidase